MQLQLSTPTMVVLTDPTTLTFCDQVNINDDYFLEQVGVICSLNLAKFRISYGTHRNLGEVMMHQVPWDLGGLPWHQLEVKLNFKEWGMLVNPTSVLGWAICCSAWAAHRPGKKATTYTRPSATDKSARNWTASASSASVSSSSRVPLLLCTS